MNGETKCARFLGLPRPAEPENLAHLLLPFLHHSNGKNGKATCVGMGGNPEIGPDPIKNALFTKRFYHSKNLALNFQVLPAPSSSLRPMNGETKCARFLGSPRPAEPENLAHLLLPSLHHSNGKAKCAGMRGTPRSAPTPIKNALFTKRIYHSRSGPGFSIFARSFLLPTPNERRDQMCQVFGLARARGARKPGTFAPSFPAPQQRQGHMCRNGGTPRSAPTPIKNALFTKRIYHSKSGPDFSIFARSLLLPTPNERRDQMCQVFGLIRPRGARKPGTFAPSSLHHRNGKTNVPECGQPRDRPRPESKTPLSRKEFITQNLALIFQFLPAPSSSLHPMNGETKCARFLGLPRPAEPENLAHLLLPSLHHSNGKNGKATCVGMGGTPRSAPTQSKTPFLRKDFIIQKIWP